MSVYIKDNASYLDDALHSISINSLKPTEIILVEDGPLTESIYNIIAEWAGELNIKSVPLPNNIGLGPALNIGLEYCNYDLVARADADDINCSDRFLKQVNFMLDNPEVDIISSWIEEFEISPGDTGYIRQVPERNQLIEYSKKRCPFNHPAVIFKKSRVISIGGYGNEQLYEDYALWLKMLASGCVGDNLQEVLVKMRFSHLTYARRGGFKYALSELKAQNSFYQAGYINIWTYFLNISLRSLIRILPNTFRKKFYRVFIRRKN
jgi:UDP-Gal:alpha-D-GlcNAc-diphosphoundecaprenol beta-1,3-galactosyltransferase